MSANLEKIEKYIKKQAEVFLLELGTFYPFGCAINKVGEVIPLGAYLEGQNPSVPELIDLLENSINQKLNDGEYLLAVIGTDVTIKKNGVGLDAIEMRIFKKNSEEDKRYVKYKINDSFVEFVPADL